VNAIAFESRISANLPTATTGSSHVVSAGYLLARLNPYTKFNLLIEAAPVASGPCSIIGRAVEIGTSTVFDEGAHHIVIIVPVHRADLFATDADIGDSNLKGSSICVSRWVGSIDGEGGGIASGRPVAGTEGRAGVPSVSRKTRNKDRKADDEDGFEMHGWVKCPVSRGK
jgi:hypothetical protein